MLKTNSKDMIQNDSYAPGLQSNLSRLEQENGDSDSKSSEKKHELDSLTIEKILICL